MKRSRCDEMKQNASFSVAIMQAKGQAMNQGPMSRQARFWRWRRPFQWEQEWPGGRSGKLQISRKGKNQSSTRFCAWGPSFRVRGEIRQVNDANSNFVMRCGYALVSASAAFLCVCVITRQLFFRQADNDIYITVTKLSIFPRPVGLCRFRAKGWNR